MSAVLPARVLIGSYTGPSKSAGVSKGLYAADWDDATGVLGTPRLLAELEHPSFVVLHPSLPLIYVVSEVESGIVVAYRMQEGNLAEAARRPTHGAHPCHVTTDPRGEFLVVSNYSSGTAAVYSLTEGIPAVEAHVIRLDGKGPDARQAGPHAHSAAFEPSGDRFWIQDLGSDRLWGFAVDRARQSILPLTPAWTALHPGCGPRHLAFHPRQSMGYVINELDSTVTVLARDASGLKPLQTVTTLPADLPASIRNDCADIHVSPDGRYLYGSNRGHDSLAVWRIADDGRLTSVQHVSSGGRHPRNFTLSPDGQWLLCANRDSDVIAVFRRDAASGRLEPAGITAAPLPVCVLFVPGAG